MDKTNFKTFRRKYIELLELNCISNNDLPNQTKDIETAKQDGSSSEPSIWKCIY